MEFQIIAFVLMCAIPLSLSAYNNTECTAATITICDANDPGVFKQCSATTPFAPPALISKCPAGSICLVPGTTATPCGGTAPICNAVGTFRFIRQNEGCKSFYSCVSQGDTLAISYGTCPASNDFNSVTKLCEPTATAGCSITTSTSTTSTSTSTSTTTPATTTTTLSTCSFGQRFPVASSCNQFQICGVSGTRTIKRCPFRLRFDANLRICRLRVNCGDRP